MKIFNNLVNNDDNNCANNNGDNNNHLLNIYIGLSQYYQEKVKN